MRTRRRRRRRLKIKSFVILFLILAIIGGVIYYALNISKKHPAKSKEKVVTVEEIKNKYNDYVITNKEATIYLKKDDNYQEIGKINKDIELSLKETDITNDTKYFNIADMDGAYYISYNDIDKIEKLTPIFEQDRYKKYIPYNENIVTKETTKFYDKSKNLLYTFNKSFDMPIIIKDNDYYGVEFNNRLLYVSKEDVASTKENHNTDSTNTNHIGTLNYHFFWDDDTENASKCDQIICHSKSQFKSHLDLINEMNLLTITMEEAEMYIDGKLQLPKSILITIDDGWRIELGIKMLNEYKMHGTVFLISSAYDPKNYMEGNDYVEFHSHTHNMHDGGKCPGGQGGGIKCLPHDDILNDFKASREALGGSTVLCYPFYEYNDYTIEIAKEAGFTMGFAGESSYLDNHFHVGSDKFTLPRFVIVTYTTMNDLRTYFS